MDADITYRSGRPAPRGARAAGRAGPGSGERLRILLGFVALIWLVELVDLFLFRGALDGAGIRPRSENGLWGVILAPFLHAGLAHLIANTVPLLVLGWLVIVRGVRDFLGVTLLVTLVAGLGVWIFGRPATIHLGASGLVFGYLGYLLLRGFWERSLLAIGIALVAGFLYGGALLGRPPRPARRLLGGAPLRPRRGRRGGQRPPPAREPGQRAYPVPFGRAALRSARRRSRAAVRCLQGLHALHQPPYQAQESGQHAGRVGPAGRVALAPAVPFPPAPAAAPPRRPLRGRLGPGGGATGTGRAGLATASRCRASARLLRSSPVRGTPILGNHSTTWRSQSSASNHHCP